FIFFCFFFSSRRRHTRSKRDWSSDVCSSDLVLVLRPDVTIPLTERLARRAKTIKSDLRYFYVHDVYRQSETDVRDRETLQAGVEYFGNVSLEADAEVIALAADIFKCNDINQFTIEIGHAGFFKQFVQQLSLSDDQLTELI